MIIQMKKAYGPLEYKRKEFRLITPALCKHIRGIRTSGTKLKECIEISYLAGLVKKQKLFHNPLIVHKRPAVKTLKPLFSIYIYKLPESWRFS